MASRDGGLHEGLGAETREIGTAMGAPQSSSFALSASTGGALSLDEAESIAARRLRELAIRLGDDDAEGAAEKGDAPFDADRHFRTHLAVRLTRQARDAQAGRLAEAAVEPIAREVPYVITEALPLTAFGDRLAALCRTGYGVPMIAHTPAQATFFHLFERVAEPVVPKSDTASGPAVRTADALGSPGSIATDRESDGLLRLVDFLNERDALADRLANLSLAQDAAAETEPSLFDTLAGMADGTVRSDAEQLFDAGTYAADPHNVHAAQLADVGGSEFPEHATGMSAEQLIAVLNEADAEQAADRPAPDPEIGHASRGLPVEVQHEPMRMLGEYDTAERAPMIIERARAELNADPGRDLSPADGQPSAFIGFFAGVSLSLIVGAVLYLVL